jgi:hypothetical protein
MRDLEDRWGRCERHGGLVDEAELLYRPTADELICGDCAEDEIAELNELARWAVKP